MKFNPKISIVIPVYNGSKYMREAIDSALAQTYKNIEIIVVNDGSNDSGRTDEIARSYGDRIRYFSKENGGVATALNLAVQEMTGDYLSWLSHDDVYFPNKIEIQVNYLERDNPIILYSDWCWIDNESKTLGSYKVSYVPPKYFLLSLITDYPVNGCTALIPKFCFAEIGLFNEEFRAVQDYEMWFRLGSRYKFKHVPHILVKSRLHPEQVTRTRRNLLLTESNNLYIWCLNNFPIDVLFPLRKISVSKCYIKLALSFKIKSNEPAFKYALRLALQNLAKNKTITYYYELFSIFYYKICPRILTYNYWKFISKSLILEIKKAAGLGVIFLKKLRQ